MQCLCQIGRQREPCVSFQEDLKFLGHMFRLLRLLRLLYCIEGQYLVSTGLVQVVFPYFVSLGIRGDRLHAWPSEGTWSQLMCLKANGIPTRINFNFSYFMSLIDARDLHPQGCVNATRTCGNSLNRVILINSVTTDFACRQSSQVVLKIQLLL